jgi:uncharacterized membrane protein
VNILSKSKNNKDKTTKSYYRYIIIAIALVLLFVGYKLVVPQGDNGNNIKANSNIAEGTLDGINLKITKADITEKASFYPYKEAGNYMEVIAVKAKDGSIRTALNTCQVCFDSGKGYYEQKGDTLVCQNCGNVFGIDDIEVVKGGCNPVPILKENKTEDGEFITISGEFLAENEGYFERWKR